MIDIEEDISLATMKVLSDSFPELVLQRVRLLSSRRIAWLRKIWTEVAVNTSGQFDSHVEIDGYLQNGDIPSLEREWMINDAAMRELSGAIAEVENKIASLRNSRLSFLAETFKLNQTEADIVQICLAIAIEPNLGRVFAYMQDHSARSYITESLAARLFGRGQHLLLDSDSPLKTWGIIREITSPTGEPKRLECDPFIKNWLLGLDGADEMLIGFSNIQPVKAPLQNWPVKKLDDLINRIINGDFTGKVRIFISGAEGSGRRSLAALVCKQLKLQLLSLNADRIPENRWEQIYMHAQRQALLSNMALAWYGSNLQARYWPQNIPAYKFQFVIGEVDDFVQQDMQFTDLRVEMPAISFEERLTLWEQLVPQSVAWPKEQTENMILRHQATIGQIVSIGQKMTQTIDDAYEALHANAGHRLGKLAQRMNGTFRWDDLIVPDHLRNGLGDFAFEATERIHFWEQPAAQRLFPQGKSLTALFSGNPGTGKTMAAQVIASELKLDLFRIDLSAVISKYIGESSKNIEQILSRAKQLDIVLLFDEADSLFGKRTELKDAHDRYANTDTNYLLQAIEEYPGIVILASNKKSNIDSAFLRRFRYIFEFPKPDAEQRLQLWRGILGELADEKAMADLDRDLAKLAGLIELTGAQIKQSVLSALFIARRERIGVRLSHLLKGIEREFAKEGKSLGRPVLQNFERQ